MNAVGWAVAALLFTETGCKGGGGAGDDDDDDTLPPVVLSTVAGEADNLDVNLVDSSCDNDLLDDLGNLELALSQVATGLSIFVDEDLGWVPCDGSVQSFDCRWADSVDDGESTWTWRLWGTAANSQLDATLSLTVTCNDANNCEECEAVVDVTASISG